MKPRSVNIAFVWIEEITETTVWGIFNEQSRQLKSLFHKKEDAEKEVENLKRDFPFQSYYIKAVVVN